MNNTTAEKIILREIITAGNLYDFTEFCFHNTAHKYIICACRHVQRGKLPISIKSVIQCLREYGLPDYAVIAADIVGGSAYESH